MPKKVLVAMSGGVDSSVSLLRILESGYDPVGVTMKLWDYKTVGGNTEQDNSCCGIEEITGAKMVCNQFGVPHYTIDFTKVFNEKVVENFSSEYLAGRTPNPCIRCNSYVKWDAFIDQADQMGIEYIATGHYAIIESKGNQFYLKKGKDIKKDQSYVLWGIPKETLKRTIFPIGDLTKLEVREIARKNNLATAESAESMEICFVADNNYRRFLNDYKPKEMSKIKEGDIIEDGKKVGSHPGYIQYTVGQRKGLKLSNPEPRYVSKIDPKNNTITVGKKNSIFKKECYIANLNLLIDEITFPIKINAQIRYNSMGGKATLSKVNNNYKLHFDEPQLAITPGQSAVFYKDDIVIGGGIIELNAK